MSGTRLDWNLVRTFTAVANAGSLAGGARALGLAHPTVARHVQLLEETLGLALFDRKASGLTLNETGERLATEAVRMRKGALAFEAATEQIRTSPLSVVRVTVAELLAEAMPDILSCAQLHRPNESDATSNLVIELLVGNQALNLLERDADIAVRHARPTQTELLCRRLGALPMAAYASQSYLDTVGKPTLDNLSQQHIIDGVDQAFFSRYLNRNGLNVEAKQVMFRSDSLACQAKAAEAGWGIAGLPAHMAASRPGLRQIWLDGPKASVDVWLVARPEARTNLALKQAFSGLAECLQPLLMA